MFFQAQCFLKSVSPHILFVAYQIDVVQATRSTTLGSVIEATA